MPRARAAFVGYAPLWGLLWAMFCSPPAARADNGTWDLGAQAAWVATEAGQLTATANLGLADAWAWHTEIGARFNDAQLVRPEVAMGVTWVYDVLAYVPAITVAGGLVYPDTRASPLGLARLELRRFFLPHAWAAVFAGVEVTRAGWAAAAGFGVSWQLESES